MTVELLTEHCLEFLSLTEGCTGSSESTLAKMSNCWKSRAAAHFLYIILHKLVEIKMIHSVLYVKDLYLAGICIWRFWRKNKKRQNMRPRNTVLNSLTQ